MDLISQSEFSRRVGVSRQAVNNRIKAGSIIMTNGKVDYDKYRYIFQEGSVQSKINTEPKPKPLSKPESVLPDFPAGGVGGGSAEAANRDYLIYRAEKEKLDVEKKQIEIKKIKSELISIEDVRKGISNAITTFKKKEEQLPDRVSATISGKIIRKKDDLFSEDDEIDPAILQAMIFQIIKDEVRLYHEELYEKLHTISKNDEGIHSESKDSRNHID